MTEESISRTRTILFKVRSMIWSREMVLAVLFVAGLVGFEAYVLKVSLRPYVLKIEKHEYLGAFEGLFIVLACWIWAVIFIRLSLTAKYGVKIFCFLLFLLAVFLEYGYQHALSQFATVEDLRIALFDANNQQRLDSVRTYIDWRAAIPCAAYGALLFRSRSSDRYSWATVGAVLIGFGVLFAVLSPYTIGQFPTVSLAAFLRTAALSPWKWASAYHGPRETISFKSAQRPANNIVFVIDESIRGDHLSINGYSRATTPALEELAKRGWLYNWGTAVSGSTCSEKSDELLLTGMTMGELPDTSYQIRRRPNIVQYAKAMGYQTHFLDGQKDTFWLGTSYDQSYLNEWRPASSFAVGNDFEMDEALARRINQIVSDGAGHFIWVIKYGAHYPYTKSFPVNTNAEWQPSDISEGEIDPKNKDQLINTYDNAIKFNLESFFRTLEIGSSKNPTVLVYTSDHGQTLSEHGERYTHCGTSVNEANVPLFIISPTPLSADTGFRATHANIFPTLLDLMNFPKAERHYNYAISLFEAKTSDSRGRYFWAEDLNDKGISGLVAFDR